MNLEGIVSKHRDAPHRPGKQCDWIKVKCKTWRAANKEQWRPSVGDDGGTPNLNVREPRALCVQGLQA
jgi:hypothetical protein